MADLEQKEPTEFLRETIKVTPVNKKKLLRRSLITASMAVVFGLIACFTFLVLEPVISNWLYPEEPPEIVTLPEDVEEMEPEDMLAENQEQTSETLVAPGDVQLNWMNYNDMYVSLDTYAEIIARSMVTVTAMTYNVDWFEDVQTSRNQCAGMVISDNGTELFVLVDYNLVKNAQKITVTFYNGMEAEAVLRQYDSATNLAVITVNPGIVSEASREQEISVARLGNSDKENMMGTAVVAVGDPMGAGGSVGYGMITNEGAPLNLVDRNYQLFLTDIYGSESGSGVLFDLQGNVVGVITNHHKISGMEPMITAYGISELKDIIEKMTTAEKMAYLGVKGVDVPKEVQRDLNVPEGLYVKELAMDSPAMRAGLKKGDVIVRINDRKITNVNGFNNIMMMLQPGETIELAVMRQSQGSYKVKFFSIMLGEVK